MASEQRRIFAFSGIFKPQPDGPPPKALLSFAISLAPAHRPVRLCYLPTAVGDLPEAIDHYTAWFGQRDDVEFSVLRLFTQPNVPDVRAHLLSQDVIFVEGGSVVNLIAVWRAHGLPEILRDCWEAGVVLTGASAGSLCWHIGGPTDSYRDNLDPFTGGLAFLPYSNGVHDDLDDQPRRTAFRELIARGELPAGYATEDGVGLLYAGPGLLEAVTVLPGRHAWHVTADGHGGYREEAIVPRLVSADHAEADPVPGLQRLGPGHAPAVLAFERVNRAYFAASISDRGEEFFERFPDLYRALLAEQAAGVCACYVLVDQDGSVLGRFNLYGIADGAAVLGYRVAQQAAGRGVATTAVRELCRLAADRHGLRTLRAAVSHVNLASQKVLAKAGFTPVGPADPADVGGKQGVRYQRDLTSGD